ncbi:hypothetical protein FHW96_004003 [Novosphingobium sp. SG751A]|nr:hypothetical protein [Novosphingobium sp. SG751A]NOW47821.1 hypothetical protein [Novosphingobium sp. SG751A]
MARMGRGFDGLRRGEVTLFGAAGFEHSTLRRSALAEFTAGQGQ